MITSDQIQSEYEDYYAMLVHLLDYKLSVSNTTTFTFRGKSVLTIDSSNNRRNAEYGIHERLRCGKMMSFILKYEHIVDDRYVIILQSRSQKNGRLFRAKYIGDEDV